MNWKEEIRKRASNEQEAKDLIALKEELEKAYQQESTEGIKKLLTKKIESMEREWNTHMNELKNLL